MDFTNHQTWSQIIPTINANNFEVIALELFRYQYHANIVYKNFVDALHILPENVNNIESIPFLPISFFKSHTIISGNRYPDEAIFVFESSGTSNSINSRHFVFHTNIYESSFMNGFVQHYGNPTNFIFLALLPSYLERKNSSLVYMASRLMAASNHSANGFYLNNWAELAHHLATLQAQERKILLLGVTYALIDFAEAFPMYLEHVIVMETGGMKGRKEEWTRTRIHDFLKKQWHVNHVHSEYGMTEMLSQAYASKDGVFIPSSTMKVMVRDINDPLSHAKTGTGCLNIIDLANTDTCAFIATDDLGEVAFDGSFEVFGRTDYSALRGCSLMSV